MTEQEPEFLELEEDVCEDVEIYEGEPDRAGPDTNEDGNQDDEIDLGGGLAFVARVDEPRDWRGALEWYRNHQTASQIGFDPDGMCLKVCRTARNINAMFATARQAMQATPNEHRIHRVRNLRRSMVGYFADARDNQPADHIATMIGRVQGHDPDSLHDTLWETNSVKANELVVVRGSYFEEQWGDPFIFGATWLNGVELDVPVSYASRIEKFQDTGPEYKLRVLNQACKAGRPAACRVHDGIMRQINSLPDSPKLLRVRAFKDKVREERIMDLRILDRMIAEGQVSSRGKVKSVVDEIHRLIRSLPDE